MSKTLYFFREKFPNLNQPNSVRARKKEKRFEHTRSKNQLIHIFKMNVNCANENFIEKTLFTRLRRLLEFCFTVITLWNS